MKKTALILSATIVAFNVNAQVKKPAAKPSTTAAKPATAASSFKTSIDSVSYALGVRIAQNVKAQGFETLNQVQFQKAMNDVLKGGKLAIPEASLDATIGAYQQKAQGAKSAVAKAEGKAFLDKNAKRAGVKVLPNGLQYEVIKTGNDTTHPIATDKVKCHYHGTLINGKVFDSSVDRGEPITFPVNGVIRGWQEILPMMTVGSKWKVYIPSDLAYGDQQAGPAIAPGSTLIFDIELLGVEK